MTRSVTSQLRHIQLSTFYASDVVLDTHNWMDPRKEVEMIFYGEPPKIIFENSSSKSKMPEQHVPERCSISLGSTVKTNGQQRCTQSTLDKARKRSKGNMDELLQKWDLLFKRKLSETGDTVPYCENSLNYSSNESCIVYENYTSYCEVRVGKKVSLEIYRPLKKPGTILQHDIGEYRGVIYECQERFFFCFYFTLSMKGRAETIQLVFSVLRFPDDRTM
ncbi:hypothetical protein MJT46_018701 [Ovis ammon polii x Ovis aries]|nr:hypothetical protein MJT46_018701 [Ovis ammon polii x Ovis aries]